MSTDPASFGARLDAWICGDGLDDGECIERWWCPNCGWEDDPDEGDDPEEPEECPDCGELTEVREPDDDDFDN